MVDKLGLDDKVHELKLGESFNKPSKVAYHSMRYDFKPASVDVTQKSRVQIGAGHSVNVSVPHVEGCGTTHTVYKGNKRPCQKECILVIDRATGEFTIERLANTVQLKKTRAEGSSRIAQPRSLSPQLNKKQNAQKKVPVRKTEAPHTAAERTKNEEGISSPPITSTVDLIGSSDISLSSDSGGEDDTTKVQTTEVAPPTVTKPLHIFHSMLSDDLRLSESSDSD